MGVDPCGAGQEFRHSHIGHFLHSSFERFRFHFGCHRRPISGHGTCTPPTYSYMDIDIEQNVGAWDAAKKAWALLYEALGYAVYTG